MIVGTLVEYIGADKMTCEDNRNRSYPLTKGTRGQVARTARGNDVLVSWLIENRQVLEWHRKVNVKKI